MPLTNRNEFSSALKVGLPWRGPLPDAGVDIGGDDQAHLVGAWPSFETPSAVVNGVIVGRMGGFTCSAEGTISGDGWWEEAPLVNVWTEESPP